MLLTVIPVADCRRQYDALSESIDAAVMRVVKSGWYLSGEELKLFEEEFAEYCGVAYVVGLANGTDALEIALRAAGCGPGTEVITVANAGMYSSAAIVQVGATPVYVDVDNATLLMSLESLRSVISDRTRVVVVTHLYGKLVDVAAIRRTIGDCDVLILEDCAQAHGARNASGRAGSFGDLAAFSFYPTKNLGAFGDAGAIATNRENLAQRIRQLSQYGWNERFHAEISGGRNSRMDEVQAAVLRVKLPHLDFWNQRRRDIFARYIDATRGGDLNILHDPSDDFVAHLCVVRHPRREIVREDLHDDGIATAIHYPVPDHHQPAMQAIPFRAAELNNTIAASHEIFSLPCFPEMTIEEIDHVCLCLKRIG